MRVVTVEQLQKVLKRAFDEIAIPAQVLLEAAGIPVAGVVCELLEAPDDVVTVVVGPTTTGAAGFVAARKLRSLGVDVAVIEVGEVSDGADLYAASRAIAERSGVEISKVSLAPGVQTRLDRSRVVVDAVIGAGLRGEPTGAIASAISAIVLCGAEVVSLGVPSGVEGATGLCHGETVEAAATVAYGLPVPGNVLYPGAGHNGRLLVTDLSLPIDRLESSGARTRIGGPVPWPERRPDGHKGSFGDVLVVAGAASYYGAPTFAAMSVLAAGAGYSRLAAPRSIVPHLAPMAPEVVFMPQEETAEGTLAASAVATISEVSRDADVVVLGPGLSLNAQTQSAVCALLERVEAPLILDGDGLTAVAGDLDLVRERTGATVLTPHLGEMARLTQRSIADLRADAIDAARMLALDLRSTVVLKGAHTLVATPDGDVVINPSGNSGMGTAGSGDVLTGTIAAACGLGMTLDLAAAAGVFCHGLAGDIAAAEKGEDGVTARDILAALPRAVRALREDFASLAEGCYGAVERR